MILELVAGSCEQDIKKSDKKCHFTKSKKYYLINRLTSQEVFSIGDEIEEVNRKMLEKLLEENDFVAVYFCKFYFIL